MPFANCFIYVLIYLFLFDNIYLLNDKICDNMCPIHVLTSLYVDLFVYVSIYVLICV